jgi:hypothetical protein
MEEEESKKIKHDKYCTQKLKELKKIHQRIEALVKENKEVKSQN